jgi:hypothetical protein
VCVYIYIYIMLLVHLVMYSYLPITKSTLQRSSRDSSVGVATGWRGRSSGPDRGKIFLLSTSSRPVLGPTLPLIQLLRGAISPGAKRPGLEADHSPPTGA